MENTRPTIRLLPKTDSRRLRRGFPWVYVNELVTDRRTKALAPGTIASLEDGERRPLGTVAVNPHSKIFARMLDADPEALIDREWLKKRVRTAFSLRDQLYDAPFYRLVHAEADGLPGVVIDRFGDVLVVQANAAWAEVLFADLAEVLIEVTGASTVVKNDAGRARVLEGLGDGVSVPYGTLDGPVPVSMNGATYMADLMAGQKTGIFYDQRPNHAFVAKFASDARVLDVFSHIGGFALAALANGAKEALAVDGSQPALDLAEAGAAQTGVGDRFKTLKSDAFAALTSLGEEGAQFEVVVCDPPAFAPSKSALEAGLRAYEKVARHSAPLVTEGGTLTLCSCSHAVDLTQFRTACLRGIGRAGRQAQLLRTGFAGPDHPMHASLAESGYLKVLTFRIMP